MQTGTYLGILKYWLYRAAATFNHTAFTILNDQMSVSQISRRLC